jgi:hypothetical protein
MIEADCARAGKPPHSKHSSNKHSNAKFRNGMSGVKESTEKCRSSKKEHHKG